MPIICKCDMCGKTSEMVPFTDAPISLTVKNYAGKSFRVQLSVTLEEEQHMQNVAKFRRIWHGKEKLDKNNTDSLKNLAKLIKDIGEAEKTLPEICDLCKKEQASRGFKDGEFLDVEPTHYSPSSLGKESWNDISKDIGNIDKYFKDNHCDDEFDDDEPPFSGKGRIGFN